MSKLIPASVKKRFQEGFYEYLDVMGREVIAVLKPYSVVCPNCIFDSVHGKSSNVYDTKFVRPVNIFVGTSAESIVFPQPFNVVSVSGVQYDPSIPDPRILKVSVCPVCRGSGLLESPNQYPIHCLVTWNPPQEDHEFKEVTAGFDPKNICRIKSYSSNYAICREAETFIIDGVVCSHVTAPRLKGLGADHIVEAYLIVSEVTSSVSTKFDLDSRLSVSTAGQTSNQADISTPIIPPTVPGDDVW